ncbi:MAG: IS3 family transposase [Candidatus Sericytochromatia bacterium]|nr:IS3 family transposase [Candidatus Sericytochromatia bacterium]
MAHATRRRFTAPYKLTIIKEADACTEPGQIGALLRREGIYSSHLTTWRRQLQEAMQHGLSPKKRGRKEIRTPEAMELLELRREVTLLKADLHKANLIIDVQKKGFGVAGPRPAEAQRPQLMAAAQQLASSVGIKAACRALGVAEATYHRHARPKPPRPRRPHPKPPRSLSPAEYAAVLDVLHAERFMDLSPREVYATLLDEGTYLCSVRTLYRILAAEHEVRERRRQRQHPVYVKPELLATRPNELWSWDITKLRGPVKWSYFHLYVILDVFSRYVVGWMVADREDSGLATLLIAETCAKQGISPDKLTIHADRGSSMRSKDVAILLSELRVTKTHSRPHVSDDNPFSESQFKTMKYRPEFPGEFGALPDARAFCGTFFQWYNSEHHHTGIALLTPEVVHYGQAVQVIAKRQVVLLDAYHAHPERFVRRPPTHAALPEAVWINPPKPQPLTEEASH